MDFSIPPRKSNPIFSNKKPIDPIMQELDHFLKSLNDLHSLSENKLINLSKERSSLKDALHSTNDQIERKTEENHELESIRLKRQAELTQVLAKLRSENSEARGRIELLDEDLLDLEKSQKELIQKKNQAIREREKKEEFLENLNKEMNKLKNFHRELEEKENIFDDIFEAYQKSIFEYHRKRDEAYHEIKRLNNTLQELKGNIRVFCKIRPVLDCDRNRALARFEISDRAITVFKLDKPCKFFFDWVFPPTATNSDVFDEISQLVQSALDGYKVCIFAYGQTGSGKTYTMEGPSNQAEKGIIQKSVELMFSSQKKLKDLGWIFSFKASAIEIYNKKVRDLFDNRKVLTGFSTSMMTPLSVPIFSYEELSPLLQRARKSRAEAETESNLHSSRSHFLFKVEIRGEKDSEEVFGVLNMIDLAGSERLKKSKVSGERLEETKAINKSLSALGTVIQALVKKDKYIPYRNSILTSILQNCLGGDGKTLMFVNVSPLHENFKETLNSLEFAQKVNACTLE
jgi:kinesin family protein C1